jgi:hypothetical protein
VWSFIAAAIVVIFDNLLGRKPVAGDRNIQGGNIIQDQYPFWEKERGKGRMEAYWLLFASALIVLTLGSATASCVVIAAKSWLTSRQ